MFEANGKLSVIKKPGKQGATKEDLGVALVQPKYIPHRFGGGRANPATKSAGAQLVPRLAGDAAEASRHLPGSGVLRPNQKRRNPLHRQTTGSGPAHTITDSPEDQPLFEKRAGVPPAIYKKCTLRGKWEENFRCSLLKDKAPPMARGFGVLCKVTKETRGSVEGKILPDLLRSV